MAIETAEEFVRSGEDMTTVRLIAHVAERDSAIAAAAKREERARLIAWIERNYFEDDESVVEMLKYLREPDLRDIESEAT